MQAYYQHLKKKLSARELIALKILAILSVYDTTNQTLFVGVAKALGLKSAEGKTYTGISFKEDTSTLRELGECNDESPYYIANKNLAYSVLAQLVIEGDLPKYKKAVFSHVTSEYGWNDKNLFTRIVLLFLGNSILELRKEVSSIYNAKRREDIMSRLQSLFYAMPVELELESYLIPELVENTSLVELQDAIKDETRIARLQVLANASSSEVAAEATYLLCGVLFLEGNIEQIRHLTVSKNNPFLNILGEGLIAFLEGNFEHANQHLQLALKTQRKEKGRTWFFDSPVAIAYVFAAAVVNKNTTKQIVTLEKQSSKTTFRNVLNPIFAFWNMQVGDRKRRDELLQESKNIRFNPLSEYFYYLGKYLSAVSITKDDCTKMSVLVKTFARSNFNYLAYQGAVLVNVGKGESPYEKRFAKEPFAQNKLVKVVQQKEKWEHIVDSLIKYTSAGETTETKPDKKERIVWLVFPDEKKNRVEVEPKLQKTTNSGWTKGRNVSLKKLKNNEVECASVDDKMIASTIYEERDYYYGGTEYYYNYDKLLLALCGHSNLYLQGVNGLGSKVEFVKTQPELIVKTEKDKFQLSFSTSCKEIGSFLKKETLTRYKVVEVKSEHCDLHNIFGSNGARFPKEAKDKVQKAMTGLSSLVTIQSDVKHEDQSMKQVRADSKIHVVILPYDEGVKAEFFVKPFKNHEPYLKPGKGGENITAEIDGVKTTTTRNLGKEIINARIVISNTPSLQEIGGYNGVFECETPDQALQFLSELEVIKSKVVIEWPQGEKMRIVKNASFDDLFLNIKKKTDWFELSGELKVNAKMVLSLRELLQKVGQEQGQFVELSDGQFLALSRKFRQRLKELESYSQQTQKAVNLNNLAAYAIGDLTDQLPNLKADKAWFDHKKRFADAMAIQPEVPSTLQAELRDYQLTGFNWLSQLAAMGVGACLADDMGLGKTMQAIAMLLQRASQGPALVVAPASVANNWMSEIRKFAPTLSAIDFRTNDRATIVENIAKFDVLVCSYGLLQSESKLLSSCEWSTIVLDEAHVIKNRNTKTAKAAMLLRGDFKILTTGTPVQNHLGELWSLFNFLNKGLLGSAEGFNKRYVADGSQESKKALNKLIKPFVLRRTKTQVLDELPSKTEITIEVELSEQEKAFYEAVRQNAIAQIESETEGNESNHLQILAEITKMRQACCHPRLVMKDSKIPSSKMTVFTELLDEVVSGNHKVLVFSQFVSFLSLAKKELDKMGVSYKYLDGSTPIKKRQEQIDAFQAGDGDVFLISLRAGGFGLNLTAADYVIHLDPWWNPAVEDQASDRAHRIGQTRPVTVYRLVTQNAIEEKIIAMHKTKRQLADNILDGTDESGKVSASELVRLIKE